jgi:hypothetical protein
MPTITLLLLERNLPIARRLPNRRRNTSNLVLALAPRPLPMKVHIDPFRRRDLVHLRLVQVVCEVV